MIALLALALQDAAYVERVQESDRLIVEQRLALARTLSERGLPEWARLECEKALARDPDNADARRALDQPDTSRNETTAQLVALAAEPYWRDLSELGTAVAAQHIALARWCHDHGMPEQARYHAREASAYEPSNLAAAEILGWTPSPLVPIPIDPDAAAALAYARGRLSEAPSGNPGGPDDRWGPDTLSLASRLSPRVHVHSSFVPQERLAALVQAGNHALDTTERLFRFTGTGTGDPPIRFAFVRPDEYEPLLAWLYRDEPRDAWEYLLRSHAGHYRNDAGEYVCEIPRAAALHPNVAHMSAQVLVHRRLGFDQANHPWVWEGAAILVEWLVFDEREDTAFLEGEGRSYCVGGPATGSARGRAPYRCEAYRAAFSVTDRPVRLLAETPIDQLRVQAAASKAASILEWLACRYRDKLEPFLRDIVAATPLSDALARHFGWSPAEFDEFWRRWALAAYRPYALEIALNPPHAPLRGSPFVAVYTRPDDSRCACRLCRLIQRGLESTPWSRAFALHRSGAATAVTEDAIASTCFDDPLLAPTFRGRVSRNHRLSTADLRTIRRRLPANSGIDPASFDALTFDAAVLDGQRPIAFIAIEVLDEETWGPAGPTAATISRWTDQARAGALLDAPLHVIISEPLLGETVRTLQAILDQVHGDLGVADPPEGREIDARVWTWRIVEVRDR